MKRYTPDMNNGDNVFVFGSNLSGRHGAGAALDAEHNWGAVYGAAVGRQGQSYAIPTKDKRLQTLPISEIKKYVDEFKGYACLHPELTFLVTEIGCGLAGYSVEDISPLFQRCPANCVLPERFKS